MNDVVDVLQSSFERGRVQEVSRNGLYWKSGNPGRRFLVRTDEGSYFDSLADQTLNRVTANESGTASNECDANVLDLSLQSTVSLTFKLY